MQYIVIFIPTISSLVPLKYLTERGSLIEYVLMDWCKQGTVGGGYMLSLGVIALLKLSLAMDAPRKKGLFN